MSTITFDTLKFVDRLVESGMPEKQAKALAKAEAEIHEANLKDLVTKEYLDAQLEKGLNPIRADMLLLKWMLALVIITTVVPAIKSLFS